jgi:YggT family protein
MTLLPLALSKDDVATYVNALFLVYLILIFCNILMSWIPRIPRSDVLRPVLDFITESTNPYLNVFRRLMNPIGGRGGLAIDLSPIIAVIVLLVVRTIIVSAIINP